MENKNNNDWNVNLNYITKDDLKTMEMFSNLCNLQK